jgi:hypothetical protein
MSDSKKGEGERILISQVAAVSWATTQVPEITAAIQNLLNAGFRNAAQLELLVMIWDKGFHPGTKAGQFIGFRNSCSCTSFRALWWQRADFSWNGPHCCESRFDCTASDPAGILEGFSGYKDRDSAFRNFVPKHAFGRYCC